MRLRLRLRLRAGAPCDLRARCLVTARGGRYGAAVARLHVEVLLAGGGDRVRLALVDQGGPLGDQRRFLRSVRARHRQDLHEWCGACTVSVGYHEPCLALTACGVRGPRRARACFWSAPSLAVRTCCWHSRLFSRSALHQKTNMSCVESSALERGARGVRPPSVRVGVCACTAEASTRSEARSMATVSKKRCSKQRSAHVAGGDERRDGSSRKRLPDLFLRL